MSILSEDIKTFTPVKDLYRIGCYINDITKIVGGPDTEGHHKETRQICNRLCHEVIDAMEVWGTGLLKPEDLRPLVNTFFKDPNEHYVEVELLGMDIYIEIKDKTRDRHIMKIVLTAKEWAA